MMLFILINWLLVNVRVFEFEVQNIECQLYIYCIYMYNCVSFSIYYYIRSFSIRMQRIFPAQFVNI